MARRVLIAAISWPCACFSGEGTLGAECSKDASCGDGQRCIAGLCRNDGDVAGTGESTATATSLPATTTDPDGSTLGSTTAIDPPTSDATSSHDTSSTGPVTPPQTDSSSGVPDPTTTGDASASSSDSGDTAGPSGGYDACPLGLNSDCPDGEVCISNLPVAPTQHVCAEPCNGVGTCALPSGGTAEPACTTVSGKGMVCILDCSGAATCPAGMTCAPLGGEQLCVWS